MASELIAAPNWIDQLYMDTEILSSKSGRPKLELYTLKFRSRCVYLLIDFILLIQSLETWKFEGSFYTNDGYDWSAAQYGFRLWLTSLAHSWSLFLYYIAFFRAHQVNDTMKLLSFVTFCATRRDTQEDVF